MAGPLDGVRVIDLTQMVSGPLATMTLADQGADVVKIERPGAGDFTRAYADEHGMSAAFLNNNRNKRSVALDLKHPDGLATLMRITAGADVFVQNFRFGVAARLGLDAATLRERNPRLVYASATGYGPEGAERAQPSFDYLGIARSGIMLAAGEPGQPPLAIAGGIADQMGAVMLAYGVLAALLAREKTGRGQEVDASHLGSMAWLQGLSLSAKLMLGFALPRMPRDQAVNPLWNHYRCGDDKWLALSMLQPDRYWAKLCGVLGVPQAATDARFATMGPRAANAAACVALLDQVFATRPRAEWITRLAPSGDFIVSVVNAVDDLPDDPQVIANDYVTAFAHPVHGPTRVVGMPVRLSDTPGSVRLPAPEFGQHTEQILLDVLGYTWDDIARLRDSEVI
jgi:crotonobetainyl-CoA:carnitine CoA-transferase CaiB-like acyl-CoA transferase